MIRLHNTKQPLATIRSMSQEDARYDKPRGLWYGIGDAWLDWCRTEEMGWIGEYHYAITLARRANLLRLTSVRAIEKFTDEFRDWNLVNPYLVGIDWARVARQFDGIEITPYQWKLRLARHTSWYYGWDCASGCIWNAKAVQRLERRTERPVEANGPRRPD